VSVVAAAWPRPDSLGERLLVVDAAGSRLSDRRIADLDRLLAPGDLLVVNDAATLPASLPGVTRSGRPIEVRLLAERGVALFRAALLGEGDWRTRTEHRPPPEPLAPGELIRFGGGELSASVVERLPVSPRLVDLRFDQSGAALWAALYRIGRPIQYAHVAAPLSLSQVQTVFGSRPWAAEMPSAGRPLSFALLAALARRRVRVAALTHAAGLSATGDVAIDAALPLPERFDIPDRTVEAIARARGRVIAVGTTVVRALEGAAARSSRLAAGPGETDLVVDRSHRRKVVDGLLTGIHEPGTSHFRLLEAFVPPALLAAAAGHASRAGYLGHEFGDSMLVFSTLPRTGRDETPRRQERQGAEGAGY